MAGKGLVVGMSKCQGLMLNFDNRVFAFVRRRVDSITENDACFVRQYDW